MVEEKPDTRKLSPAVEETVEQTVASTELNSTETRNFRRPQPLSVWTFVFLFGFGGRLWICLRSGRCGGESIALTHEMSKLNGNHWGQRDYLGQ